MLSNIRFSRGLVSRVLGISALIAILFVAGCTTSGSSAQFAVTTTSGQLATVVINSVYPSATLTAANGTAPYTWAWSGNTPPGMSLSTAGVVSGTPTSAGSFTFTVTVTDSATPTAHTATASLTVLINPALTSVTLNPTMVTGGTASTATVTLNGAAVAAASVTLSSSSSAATVPATVTVAAGATTANFQVTTSGVISSTPTTITATFGVAKTATLTVNPPTVQSVALAVSTITGGASTTGTVTLTGPAATGGDTVTLSSDNAAAQVPASVSVPAGQTSAQFNVTTTAGGNATAHITATFNSSSPTTTLTVVPAPAITSFTAAAGTITAGGSTTLTGVFSNGTGSVSNGVGAVNSGSAVSVSPAANTTYTLTVTNAAGTAVTKQVTVTVVAAPAITSFTAAAATITAGTSTTLTGVFSNGTGSVDNSVGPVTSSTPVTVSPATTTTYTLTVTNTASATATKQVTVTVVPAPAITSFVSGASTITAGSSTTLTAVFTNGTGSVNNSVGIVTSGIAATVSPAATITYTLTVTNTANTSVTMQVTVTVVAAPVITSFTPAAATITAGLSTTLTANFTGGTGIVNNGVGAVTSGTAVTVSPAATTTYTLTVTNSASTPATATLTATVTVVPAPAITSFTPAAAAIVTGNSTTLTAVFTGGTGSVDHGVGVVTSGTPVSISPTSTTTYTLTVTNSATTPASVTATTSVTVDVPPAFTSANNYTFTVGSPGSFTVVVTGFPLAGLTSVGTLPGTVTFHDNGNNTATISGTPTGSAASYPITITANNGVSPNATQFFTLNVVLVQAPTITSANSVTFTAGTASTFTVTTTGSPVPALAKTGSLPTGVNFLDNGNGTATISGSAAAVSSSSITITASNGTLPNATQTFTFNVVAAPAITSFIAAAPTITVGGSTTLTGVFTGGTGSVNNAVGTVTSGTAATVSPSATTTYTLTVTNAATTPVSVTLTATVTVVAAPVITSFTGTTTILSGNSTNITPTFSNGTGSISPTVGTVTSGTGYSVSPTTTTTYTLTVTNSVGSKTTSTVTITVNAPPQITSANNDTFTVGAIGTFTVTTSGSPIPSLSITSGSLPSPITFVDNGDGTATISGTPAGTSVNPITITASNTISPNATQSFTLNVTNNSGQVSGQISLSNTCGTVTLPTFTVTINTTTPQSVQTDSNGNYSFASVPNGTYTITPSISGAASSIFYPISYTGVVVNSGSVSGENFSAVVGYDISGNVTYSGSQTGQTYLALQNINCGGNGGPGTSITQATLTSGGAYTIHGVQPGNYSLNAWMDSTGVTSGTKYPGAQGQSNMNDPTGSNTSVAVSTASLTGVGVTMSSPTYSTPSSNPGMQIFPSAGGVAIFYQPSTVKTSNGNKEEDANEYVVQWAVTDKSDADGPMCSLGGGTGGAQFLTVAGTHTFYAVGANGGTVWILNNTMLGAGTFTSGQSYCFQARSFNTLATTTHPAGWTTPLDGLGNPAAVKIVAPGSALCSSNCTTVSGKVTIPTGVTPASGAPLYAGFYQQSGSSNGPSALYATEISAPVTGANSYSITIPSGSNYYIFGILDQNNDGQIDAGDVTDTNNNNSAPAVTLSGSTMTVNDNSLPATNSVASVQTQYSTCGTGCGNYNLNLDVREGNKLPVAVTLYSGPNLLNPVDMSQCSTCGTTQFQYSASFPGGTPTVGDTYKFTVTYSDGSVDQGSAGTINGKVTAFGSTGAVVGASDLPTNLSPNGTSSTSLTPNFTWTFPSNPSNYSYSFYMSQNNCTGNCTIWQVPSQNSNTNGFTYAQTQTGATTGQITWGTDPTGATNAPSVSALTSGATYYWNLTVQDANGNQAQTSVNYAP